ncbi:ketopantoate hydroxymethyltransferase [Halopseudomonas xinjiangensis]|uniref:3-methyl-2-oxobutanoate hydroxymethyltransferase n=1 Tax=Halopseudomonas xinjiangensis TaxID=487184 RepID=A0A1H1W741_9GAMM|nr:3-methyl-2-oxobutanoate hydroxymethyltransferase [Halopseudomonas xinjiangensis]SDS92540.1 ketopantoate hydroxymethyltransferase [Halopseudomonas xinjiangensis]
MPDVTLTTLNKLKQSGEKIVCLTAYDATFAHLECQAGVEVILIGDSLGMVLQGHDSTLPVTVDDMVYHTRSVKRGNRGALIMADLPFMSYATLEQAVSSSTALMQAGAHMVKLEGGGWLADTVTTLTRNGIPVCAHLGLTPQTVNVLGGYKVQGRDEAQAKALLDDARKLEAAGAAMLLLECVPSELGAEVTRSVQVPVIGIGAGSDTDGQVLVVHDLLGLSISGRLPRFVKNFMAGQPDVQSAVRAYVEAVKRVEFPSAEHEF